MTLPPPKLLATDLDGTLLASDGTIHPEDAEAIRELLRRGVRVTFCTGRMHSGCGHLARQLDLSTPLVCLDGVQIVDPRSASPVHVVPLPDSSLNPLRSALHELKPMTFLFGADRIYHDAGGDPAAPYVSIWTERMQRVDDVIGHESWEKDALGLVAVGEQSRIGELQRLVNELAELESAAFISNRPGFEGVWAMVIRRRGISKASGLQRLGEMLGVGLDEMVVVGDWLNDLTMMRAAGRSYAMGQSPPEVVDAADEVLHANHHTGGGVAEAARRAGLL
ncbi:MAG: HAD hydrolase family protein [Polyangiaceae bacterium]